MPLFRKNDQNAAMRRCIDALTTLFDDARKHAPPLDDDVWQARLQRRLVDSGAGVFLWGFLEALASKDVKTWEVRANVIGHAFSRTIGHQTASAVFDELPSNPDDIGTELFTDGQKAARRYIKGDHTDALSMLIGLLDLKQR